MTSITRDQLTQVPLVPEFSIVDVLDSRWEKTVGEGMLVLAAEIMKEYFPSYDHVVTDLARQLATGIPPENELVHAWLVFRDGQVCGLWVTHINTVTGVIMMLFGAIHQQARANLPREYLARLVGFMNQLCISEAKAHGFSIMGVILESEEHYLARWESCGFFVADREYREPKHGIFWAEFGPLEFYDDYSACVLPLGDGVLQPKSDIAHRCLTTLMLEHYRLPRDHEFVQGSLRRALEVST